MFLTFAGLGIGLVVAAGYVVLGWVISAARPRPRPQPQQLPAFRDRRAAGVTPL
jgi:hypothetical protein